MNEPIVWCDPLASGQRTPLCKIPTPLPENVKADPICTLEDALSAAYVYNPDLSAQRANLNLAVEGIAKVNTEWRPDVSFFASQAADKSWHKVDQDPYNTRQASRSQKYKNKINLGKMSVQAKQNLYAGGGTLARTKIADEKFSASYYALISTEQEVFSKVIEVYVNVVAAKELLIAEQKNEKISKELFEQTKVRCEVGDQTPAELSASRSELAKAVVKVTSAQAALENQRATLMALIGRPVGCNLKIPEVCAQMPTSLEKMVEISIKYYPPLLGAQANEKCALAVVSEATTHFLPSAELSASASRWRRWSTDRYRPFETVRNTAEDRNTRDLSVNLSVTIPIYQKGVTNVQYRETEQKLKQARLDREKQRRSVGDLCTQHFMAYEAALSNVEGMKIALEAGDDALKAIKLEYELGQKPFLDTLVIQQRWLEAYQMLIKARANLITASYKILQMLGKLRARELSLNVPIYNPFQYYRDYKNSIFSFGKDESKSPLFDVPIEEGKDGCRSNSLKEKK